MEGAHVYLRNLYQKGTLSNSRGEFRLSIPLDFQRDTIYVTISYVGYLPLLDTLYVPDIPTTGIRLYRLRVDSKLLDELVIQGEDKNWGLPAASEVEIETKELGEVPALSSDISHVLGLLSGVISNRGLSNSYSVRGGNYQENLFYIDGLPMYTPYLARSGQQQGLSLANVSLTESLTFSSGGWQARYGDKLSSMLDVKYKDPDKTHLGLLLGLLGAEAHLETSHKTRPWRLLLGTRYKDTRYFLQSLDTQGEYLPRFFDIQGMLRVGLSSLPGRSELLLFGSYARNRYLLRPSTRESTFGTIDQPLRFSVAFEGEELLAHDIFRGGMKWSHQIGARWRLNLLNSFAYSLEREYFDVGSAFRLCDIVPRDGENIDICLTEIGSGTRFEYARNSLLGRFLFSQGDINFLISEQHQLSAGIFLQSEDVFDRVDEYGLSFTEDVVTNSFAISAEDLLRRSLWGGFLQHTFYNLRHTRWITTGVRLNYSSLSNEWLVSPRLQFSFLPGESTDVLYKFALGLYAQPPFYHELQTVNNNLLTQRLAQQSLHLLAGSEHKFNIWETGFRLQTDAYYKQLSRLIPYDQENIRVRYYAEQNSKGYAYGLDTRLYGFFVPNQESWLSVSYLRTEEDIELDTHRYIRRPTDQRFTMRLFFKDYFPNLPSWQVYTKMLFGTGMPFNPMGEPQYRNVFQGESYYQLDIGFSKIFFLRPQQKEKSLSLSLEVFNLLGSNQNISYSWVQSKDKGQFAVPNDFTARFINFKVRVSI